MGLRPLYQNGHRRTFDMSEKCAGTEVATSFDHVIGTSQAHASEIRNLQQLTIADPGSGKVGLGLAGCGAITA